MVANKRNTAHPAPTITDPVKKLATMQTSLLSLPSRLIYSPLQNVPLGVSFHFPLIIEPYTGNVPLPLAMIAP